MIKSRATSALGMAVLFCLAGTFRQNNAEGVENAVGIETLPEPSIWRGEIGDGFVKFAHTAELKLSRAFGTRSMGSAEKHDFLLSHIQSGIMLSGTLAPDRWYAGNVEATGQLIAGVQDNPGSAYLLCLNAGLRYHFNTHSRVVPFLAGSVGTGITDVGGPDLGGKFQFNEQAGVGARYFLTRNYALTLEYTILHISNGGIRQPNDGATGHMVSMGFSWMF